MDLLFRDVWLRAYLVENICLPIPKIVAANGKATMFGLSCQESLKTLSNSIRDQKELTTTHLEMKQTPTPSMRHLHFKEYKIIMICLTSLLSNTLDCMHCHCWFFQDNITLTHRSSLLIRKRRDQARCDYVCWACSLGSFYLFCDTWSRLIQAELFEFFVWKQENWQSFVDLSRLSTPSMLPEWFNALNILLFCALAALHPASYLKSFNTNSL